MRTTMVQYKENLYANFWFVPLLIIFCAILLAALMLYVDHLFLLHNLKEYLNTFLSANSSRTVLSIIATAVVTIASVTFSITVLILSITSNQLGPRLLPNFMRQRTTQFVLGFFIGTFVYTLLILQLMSIDNAYYSIPYLAVTVGILLGIICFFLLIYFIHFVCHAIEIDNVLTSVVEEISHCINRQLDDKDSFAKKYSIHKVIENESQLIDSLKHKKTTIIYSHCDGYIQTIDSKTLVTVAEKHTLVIKLHYGIGKFVFHDLPLFTVYSDEDIDDDIKNHCHRCLQIGRRRSTVEDIEFAFEQLTEIALRALSPGINNPYTAIHCLDRIIQGFSMLAKKNLPSRTIANKQGELRIIRPISSYRDIVATAFNPLRQQAKGDLCMALDIIAMITRLLHLDMPSALFDALVLQAKYTYESTVMQPLHEADKKDLQEFYQGLQQLVEEKGYNLI